MTQALVPALEVTSSFTSEQLTALEQPLNVQVIKERKGPGGKLLKYITTKTAIETANQIFGIGKWGYRVLSRNRETVGDQTFYTADIELYVMGCPFPFPGEGEGVPQNNTVDQHAKARKEAVSDALKRALRHYGDQFGLALYDEESLVENADGHLTRVKDVHPGSNAQQSRRVVDSHPQASQMQKSQPPSSTLNTNGKETSRPSGGENNAKVEQLLAEYEALNPEYCGKHAGWKFAILRSVLQIATGPLPAAYSDDDVRRVDLFLAERRKGAA